MKVKLELKQITKKNIADVIAFTGVVAILCVVAFPTPSDIPVGDMAYQNYAWDVWQLSLSFVVYFLFA